MNSEKLPSHIPLAYTVRGDHVENVFYGSFAVVDFSGKLVARGGDTETPLFTRSALKPFQALPLMAHDGAHRLNLSPTETAMLCASHNGEPRHAQAAARMLARVGATETALRCGAHVPYFYTATNTPAPTNQTWSPLQHNCSGKHSGMVMLSTLLGADPADYLQPEGKVQQHIRAAVGYAAGLDATQTLAMPWGTDGCSAPNFALTLPQLARAYSWLADPAPDARFGTARQKLFAAMAAHPEMVSGEGRHDLALTLAGHGDWVNKVGADGVQTLSSRKHQRAIALKISDGSAVALMVAFGALLDQLGMLDDAAKAVLAKFIDVRIRSVAGVDVGRWVACLKI